MLLLYIHLYTTALRATDRAEACLVRVRSERGQTSAEYALVLIGAASVALLLAVWAKKTNRMGRLFDTVFDNVINLVR